MPVPANDTKCELRKDWPQGIFHIRIQGRADEFTNTS